MMTVVAFRKVPQWGNGLCSWQTGKRTRPDVYGSHTFRVSGSAWTAAIELNTSKSR